MPKLEKYEVQEDRIWYRVEVTDEQLEEFKKAEKNEDEFPEWVWDLDWEIYNSRPGNDDVIYIKSTDD